MMKNVFSLGLVPPDYQVERQHLPEELIVLIATYCSIKDQRSLSHCDKFYRATMSKANLIRYNLTDEYSVMYATNPNFRKQVDSSGNVWKCSLYNFRFRFRLSKVTDVSFLSSVHTLTLEGMPGVTDVSALSKVDTLKLWDLPGVTDVSALSTVHTLTLEEMRRVEDVSALSTVHTLTLGNMARVTDVSALSTVHTLTLANMPGVADVSALSTVQTLTLYGMDGVTDVSALSTVHRCECFINSKHTYA